jgi:hypothetical protein
MFKWLTNFVDDARIAFAYLGYERECKKQWVADAERTYSTTNIERNIKALMVEPLLHVASTFNAPIRDLESKRENIRCVVAEAKEKLAILDRDYKSELDVAYIVQNAASGELDECRRKLSSAYDELNSAKSSLDSWYSKAEGTWFGNGGKKLPKSAFFGQDLSDRDHYKYRRDRAASEVGRYKSERSSIVSRLNDARATVKRIKEARQQMFDLKKAGFDKRVVTSAIKNGNHNLNAIGEEIAQFAKSRDNYIDQAKVSLGVYGLEKEIERLRRDKETRIEEFDSEPAVLERKAKHRAEWLEVRRK